MTVDLGKNLTMTEVKDLITGIARALVDHPVQVSVEVKESPIKTVFELRVAKVDLGKIIGKHGRTADALRTIWLQQRGRHGKDTCWI